MLSISNVVVLCVKLMQLFSQFEMSVREMLGVVRCKVRLDNSRRRPSSITKCLATGPSSLTLIVHVP